jgi:D-allulose-6-phosphate 3-epimerase
MEIKISPTLMCMDLLRLREQVAFLDAHADFLHIDIMDGHYVPNLTLSPMFMTAVGRVAKLPMDAHLMTIDPSFWVPIVAEAGAAVITPHAETINAAAFRIIDKIRSFGCQVGVALNPSTPLDVVKHYIHLVDKITLMAVDPGFAGQRFIPGTLDKIEEAVRVRAARGLTFLIEVDGACDRQCYRRLADAGADVFVVGPAALFNLHDDIAEAWKLMVAEIDEATR